MPEFRVVADSNVILAGRRARNPASPNLEFLQRWRSGEVLLLYNEQMLREYVRKLGEAGVDAAGLLEFATDVATVGSRVPTESFHLPKYPADADDIPFLLCAWNGRATHLVSYDPHLLDLADAFHEHFRICATTDFLAELRVV